MTTEILIFAAGYVVGMLTLFGAQLFGGWLGARDEANELAGIRPIYVIGWERYGDRYQLRVMWSDDIDRTYVGRAMEWRSADDWSRCPEPLQKWLYEQLRAALSSARGK